MGEQLNADGRGREHLDFEIGWLSQQPRSSSAPIFRAIKIALFTVALSSVFTGCSSFSSQSGTVGQANEPEGLRWELGTYVLNGYANTQGLSEPTRDDLDSIAEEICSDLRSGGDGKFYHPELVPSDETLVEWATALNYAYATSVECHLSSDYTIGNNLREAMLGIVVEGDEFSDSYKSNLVVPNYGPSSNSYYNGTVMCNDGTISNAGGTQGACSWHGGVSD